MQEREITEVNFRGWTFTIAALNTIETKQYVLESRTMLKDKDNIPPEKWFERSIQTIKKSLADAGDTEWNDEAISRLSPKTVEWLNTQILQFTGLIPTESGEVRAA